MAPLGAGALLSLPRRRDAGSPGASLRIRGCSAGGCSPGGDAPARCPVLWDVTASHAPPTGAGHCSVISQLPNRPGSRSAAAGRVPLGLKTSSLSSWLQQKIQSLVETPEQKQLQGKTLWINVSRGFLRVLFVLFNFRRQLPLWRERVLGRVCKVSSPNGAGKLETCSETCEDHRKARERWTAAWERRQKERKIKGRCGLLCISQRNKGKTQHCPYFVLENPLQLSPESGIQQLGVTRTFPLLP